MTRDLCQGGKQKLNGKLFFFFHFCSIPIVNDIMLLKSVLMRNFRKHVLEVGGDCLLKLFPSTHHKLTRKVDARKILHVSCCLIGRKTFRIERALTIVVRKGLLGEASTVANNWLAACYLCCQTRVTKKAPTWFQPCGTSQFPIVADSSAGEWQKWQKMFLWWLKMFDMIHVRREREREKKPQHFHSIVGFIVKLNKRTRRTIEFWWNEAVSIIRL